MKKSLIGALAVTSTLLSPMTAMAQTEVHFCMPSPVVSASW